MAGVTAITRAQWRNANGSGGANRRQTNGDCFEANSEATTNKVAVPRPYSTDLTPIPSPLHPHCLCSDRLRLWRPTLDRGGFELGSELTNEHVEIIVSLIISSYVSGTRGVYGSGLLVFNIFCDKNGIPDPLRCPASTPLVLLFISQCAGFYSGSTLANYVFGVKAWHIVHGQPWSIDDDQI